MLRDDESHTPDSHCVYCLLVIYKGFLYIFCRRQTNNLASVPMHHYQQSMTHSHKRNCCLCLSNMVNMLNITSAKHLPGSLKLACMTEPLTDSWQNINTLFYLLTSLQCKLSMFAWVPLLVVLRLTQEKTLVPPPVACKCEIKRQQQTH